MKADDEVCMCFHVSFRKLLNFIRRTKPQRASELSNCFSAGTGCGWCRPTLRQLAEIPHRELPDVEQIDAWVSDCFPGSEEEYSQNRAQYRARTKANPQ